ncbi:hypothetical protein CL629_01780 [bacterium]|nr:hypothetical protein [bacterium]|tara:strand:- start:1166 stop:1723 length:558 start_codon:yes stop_codon:yes gene_type:complete
MLILYIIVVGVVVGYVVSFRKSIFSKALCIFASFLGSLIGALLSLGDSVLYLKYPFLNMWTVPVIFSVALAFIAVFAHRGGIKRIILLVVLVIAVIAGAFYLYSTFLNRALEDSSVTNSRAVDCLPEQRDVDACIEIYQPVCGIVNVQCVTTPCYPVQETFENSCKACSNSLVSSYVEGECLAVQ